MTDFNVTAERRRQDGEHDGRSEEAFVGERRFKGQMHQIPSLARYFAVCVVVFSNVLGSPPQISTKHSPLSLLNLT